jgi:carboxyl-terminal processing protease
MKKVPANKQEQYNEWKKFIKYNILQEVESMNSKEEAQKEKRFCTEIQLKDTIKYSLLLRIRRSKKQQMR